MLQHEIVFCSAYDKRSSDPKKNYGIHGVNMTWYVKHVGHAVQFVVYTNWHLPHVEKELDGNFPHLSCHPLPSDVGYHSKRPMYQGQTPIGDDCKLTGGECYYDGSSLHATDVFQMLVTQGHEAVWTYLDSLFWKQWPELVIAPRTEPTEA